MRVNIQRVLSNKITYNSTNWGENITCFGYCKILYFLFHVIRYTRTVSAQLMNIVIFSTLGILLYIFHICCILFEFSRISARQNEFVICCEYIFSLDSSLNKYSTNLFWSFFHYFAKKVIVVISYSKTERSDTRPIN